MERYIISVGTITHALKGRDLLNKLGFKAKTERRTRDIGKYGCGYAVVIENGDIEKAKSALLNASIKILKIEKAAPL